MSQSTAQLTAQIARASAALQQMDECNLTELTDRHPTTGELRSVYVVLLRCSMLLLYPKLPYLTPQIESDISHGINALAFAGRTSAAQA